MQVFRDIEQGTEAWAQARCGIPTASCFSHVLAKGEGKTRATYLRKVAGEVLTGQAAEGYTNAAMDRGKAWEAEARAIYEFTRGVSVEEVGFVRLGRAGASPDGLVGEDGGVEIKTNAPHILLDIIERGVVPSEHKAQIQGNLWITGRRWWDFVSYWPSIPIFIHRVERDEAYIAALAQEVARFNDEVDALVARIRAYGGA